MESVFEESYMRRTLGLFGPLALVASLFVLAFAASPAKAAFGIQDWEAVTCSENVDTPADVGLPNAVVGLYPLPQDPDQCNYGTPAKWFTHAAGHPDFGTTDFTLNNIVGFPDGFVKDIVFDIPEGLGVNPESTPVKCTVAELSMDPPTCPLTSLVGFNYFTVATEGPPPCANPTCVNARVKVPVFNLVPFDGVPSMVGFPTTTPGHPTLVVGDLDPVDQHVIFTISDVESPLAGGPPVIGSRLVFNGRAGQGIPGGLGTYLTMPSNCPGNQETTISADQHADPGNFVSQTSAPPGGEITDCDDVPFNPSVDVTTGGQATDSPNPATVDVQIPFNPSTVPGSDVIANSHLLTARVTLPETAGINPALANDLEVCTDAQFKKGTDDPIECPDGSRIGSVEVQTPALPPDSVGGDVYVGEPLNNNPSSGNQFRIFIHAVSERYGVNVRLIGNIFPDPDTGQLTAVVDDNPQAPFTSFQVQIDGGPRGALSSPNTCGPNTTTTVLTPWSGTADQTPSSSFNLTEFPGGGPCPQTLADRPFSPDYSAGLSDPQAGSYSPFQLHIGRDDGEQEIKEVNVTLPPGVAARLAGVPYCSEAAIQAARDSSGVDEQSSPSCPAASHVGTVGVDAGSGSEPYHVDGDVYLAGPYKGAPISMVFVNPAVAGPFDLGTVVVRTALNVDPATVQVNAVSDRIPDIFGGVKLDIRSIDVNIDRNRFTTNATTCRRAFGIGGLVYGGGANPLNPAFGVGARVNTDYRAMDCRALEFKPRFYTRLFTGPATQRSANPKFRAVVDARNGDANLLRSALVLPNSTILDQDHIRTVCTRAQLASRTCPKRSVYGYAYATSPLLDDRLEGAVFLVSSDNVLPDLLVDLRGQIPVQLRGELTSTKGRLKTIFFPTPDVALDKFILYMRGGNRGLLVNTRDLCRRPNFSALNLRAQNSRRMRVNRLRMNVPACRVG